MNKSKLLLIIGFSLIIIRFLMISFKIIRNSKTINFFFFTPTVIDETNKKYLLAYSLAIAFVSLFIIISFILFESHLVFTLSLSVYFLLIFKAEKYTK